MAHNLFDRAQSPFDINQPISESPIISPMDVHGSTTEQLLWSMQSKYSTIFVLQKIQIQCKFVLLRTQYKYDAFAVQKAIQILQSIKIQYETQILVEWYYRVFKGIIIIQLSPKN